MSTRYGGGISAGRAELVQFGVLGPVVAWEETGEPVALKGPQHRAVLGRLIVARGRVVPVELLVDDLWADPPTGAVSAVRTFVAALRRAVEPDRAPRTPPRVLVTVGPGYAFRAEPDAVDAWRFERVVSTTLAPEQALKRLDEALGWWRGPAYADFAEAHWATAERSRLTELRLRAAEQQAEARLALGLAGEAIPDLDAHVTEHPWREDAWRLLALALYQSDRQGDALAVLRRARALLVEQLAVDPGPALRRLETDILNQAEHLRAPGVRSTGVGKVWEDAAAAYDEAVGAGARARLESTVGLLRNLAVTGGGGLEAARRHRLAAIAAAEEIGDVELTARVIGAYDVPAIWTRSDDEEHARQVVAAAERTLVALPADRAAARARLLATIALESRGTRESRGPEAAAEAEQLARRLDDPSLLGFALNGVFMQTFQRAGLAPRRDQIGAELINLATAHDLVSYEVLGHLIRIQALSALGDFTQADHHAAAVDLLAVRRELPLVGVFTQWYRVLRLAAEGQTPTAGLDAAYREAAKSLDGAGMPGLQHGLLPLALLAVHGQPGRDEDWGPYEPWVRPLVLLADNRPDEAAASLTAIPDPPKDLMYEAMWCLLLRAAVAVGNQPMTDRARAELAPAAGELAGASSGLLTFGWVSDLLAED
ncbi:AfsR/SARP family transcriptional regulator [Kribbella qitaiheensis]|uniref:AfsR/SARP family transcriptional regulator n=1 Tax=Kribbella qitaiheensis TaxID=1544730 RepID=A0A7G6WZ31_9ACTN|nr:BTAD domain-containing putative transcriptional regulator [Kribbella qitaiheensis]QNE19246.1 AfsR/SARP family transcriptional regulator [Kribbella qitaiheensis]